MRRIDAPAKAAGECPRFVLQIDQQDLARSSNEIMEAARQAGAVTTDHQSAPETCWITFAYDSQPRVYQVDLHGLRNNLATERKKFFAEGAATPPPMSTPSS